MCGSVMDEQWFNAKEQVPETKCYNYVDLSPSGAEMDRKQKVTNYNKNVAGSATQATTTQFLTTRDDLATGT